MAPKKASTSAAASKKASTFAMAPAARPALEKSRIYNAEGLQKIRPLVGSETNEWGATAVKSGSVMPAKLSAIEYPFFLHSIVVGLVPPFSPFFHAILEHYQIHALHLQPNAIAILSIFAFTCEAFLGVEPSVALFRHFYSLRITTGEQSSGCASFRATDGAAFPFINMVWTKKVEDFRKRWVYMDTREANPLYVVLAALAPKNSGWGSRRLSSKGRA
jgi:hypothetical protein